MGVVTVRNEGDVAVVDVDDGKANALGFDLVAELDGALAEVAEARALVLNGRPGRFSAGFDLNVMQKEPDRALGLMDQGARVAIKLWEFPRPVVLGVTGHAMAMGAVLLLCADYRVGAAGDFKIGLNEVRINLAVPPFATELARARLSPVYFNRATALAEVFDPAGALAAGYLDEVVHPDEVTGRAVELATAWADELKPGAFRATRRITRGELTEWLLRSLDGG